MPRVGSSNDRSTTWGCDRWTSVGGRRGSRRRAASRWRRSWPRLATPLRAPASSRSSGSTAARSHPGAVSRPRPSTATTRPEPPQRSTITSPRATPRTEAQPSSAARAVAGSATRPACWTVTIANDDRPRPSASPRRGSDCFHDMAAQSGWSRATSRPPRTGPPLRARHASEHEQTHVTVLDTNPTLDAHPELAPTGIGGSPAYLTSTPARALARNPARPKAG